MDSCPNCGKDYKRIAAHFQHNPSHRPKLSEQQHEIITGVLMADGHIEETSTGTYRLKVNSINKQYLEHLSDKFGIFSNDIYLNESAQASKERTLSRGGFGNSVDFNDVWAWQTTSIPELSKYRNWYDGKKVWPTNINITPTVLRHLYVGDGCWESSNSRIRIAMNNERGNEEKVESYFEVANLPVPKWNTTEKSHAAYWSATESEELLNYIGEPIAGFKYKWGNDNV